MTESPRRYGESVDEVRGGQLRETRALTVRERLELLDRLNQDSDQLSGIATRARRRGESDRSHLPEVPGWTTMALDGCGPTPLAGYLKALGVLRVLGEQLELHSAAKGEPHAAHVRGWWEHERFVLWSPLDRNALVEFFLHRYRPTPILAPWNGGSGFYPKDSTDAIEAIEGSAADRFHRYATAIAIARDEVARMGLEKRPAGDRKDELLRRLRSVLPEDALSWIDAAIVLTNDGPKYPPLLGTGGNDGRLEFTNNFMQRLVDVLDVATGEPHEHAGGMLAEALYGDPEPGLRDSAIGQFSPGAAGGPNSTSGFSGGAHVNPWDYVLMLEGAVLFAARAARRLEGTGDGHLAFPFTVRAVGAGSGATSTGDEGDARAETWVPLWGNPTSLPEVASLLGEGRVSVGRRTARDGLDFARAIAKLGSDRGIRSFHRYGFLMRSGRAYLATPLSRVEVRRNAAADLIDELDEERWLARFRRFARGDDRPARLKSLARRLDDRLFALTEGRTSPVPPAQAVLVLLGEAHDYLATSPAARERVLPAPHLSKAWFAAADDRRSAEFQLAAALAGIRTREAVADGPDRFRQPIISNVWPLRRRRERGQLRHRWNPHGANRAVWGPGGLDANLASVLDRRLLDAEAESIVDLPLDSRRAVSLHVLSEWLAGRLDEARTAALFKGLSFVKLPIESPPWSGEPAAVPAALAALKPLFTTHRQLRRAIHSDAVEPGRPLPKPTRVARLLSAGRTRDALDEGSRLLRGHRFSTIGRRITVHGKLGPRLLGALIAPLHDSDLRSILDPLTDPFDRSESEPRTLDTNPETLS